MGEGAFADRLRELRESRGLSQYALAKKSGLTKQALSRLELGEREPGWHTVQLLALALNVDCAAFRDETLRLPDEETPARRGRPRKVVEADKVEPVKGKTTKKRKGKEG